MDQPTPPIRVFASVKEITLNEDIPASFHVAIEIDEPYQLISAIPGNTPFAQSLFPLRVGLTQGQGIAVYADYPQGETVTTSISQEQHEQTGIESGLYSILAHTGRIEFEIAIEKAPGIGIAPGAPLIGISFQTVTENTIQHPQSVELPIEIQIND